MTDNKSITVIWPPALNEDDSPMLWLGTWLVGTEGMEGDWFHSGRGEAETEHQVPESVPGMRLRKWPNGGWRQNTLTSYLFQNGHWQPNLPSLKGSNHSVF